MYIYTRSEKSLEYHEYDLSEGNIPTKGQGNIPERKKSILAEKTAGEYSINSTWSSEGIKSRHDIDHSLNSSTLDQISSFRVLKYLR